MLVTICFLLANIFFGFVKEVNVYNFGTRRALHRAYEVREVRFIQLQTISGTAVDIIKIQLKRRITP